MKLKLVAFLIVGMSVTACSKNAEVTWHKNCDAKTNKASLDFTVPLYSEPDSNSKVVEFVPVGTVVKVFEARNHNVWAPKYFIKVQTAKNEGYMSPRCFVVGQDPANSVWRYSKGLVTDSKPFYDPADKAHYPRGTQYSNLKDLPKEKIPLSELTKGLEEGTYINKNMLKQN
ncbi:Lsa16 family lipoprotein adhesin [Leptospira bouyouniensis]|uniref:Lsa16 family lipoprotein adhesin n=1 Tax=Leptospira bouyouniensis TaxID=2484911 RepID=UPI001090B2A5|nr:SH3 domain-containing protein [Leptospira bouyouniensis]TGM80343.1 SH3 domain-containing protein [Leptospira bouyouniensis]